MKIKFFLALTAAALLGATLGQATELPPPTPTPAPVPIPQPPAPIPPHLKIVTIRFEAEVGYVSASDPLGLLGRKPWLIFDNNTQVYFRIKNPSVSGEVLKVQLVMASFAGRNLTYNHYETVQIASPRYEWDRKSLVYEKVIGRTNAIPADVAGCGISVVNNGVISQITLEGAALKNYFFTATAGPLLYYYDYGIVFTKANPVFTGQTVVLKGDNRPYFLVTFDLTKPVVNARALETKD